MIRTLAAVALSLSLGANTSRKSSASLSTTVAQPTGNPNASLTSGYLSSAIPGALKLNGCTGYRITLTADGSAAARLSGAGTVDIYYWPDGFAVAQPWPINLGLVETVSVTATSCASAPCKSQVFPDRVTTGLNGGWIYAAPNGVTVSAGSTALVTIEAACTQ